jgi:hypothetical protein
MPERVSAEELVKMRALLEHRIELAVDSPRPFNSVHVADLRAILRALDELAARREEVAKLNAAYLGVLRTMRDALAAARRGEEE